MRKSGDKRLEALFKVESPLLEKQLMNILAYNMKDNVNSYVMQEDGTYTAKKPIGDDPEFNVHKEFFDLDADKVMRVTLVD